MKYAEVIEKVLPKKPARKEAPRRTIFFQDFERQGDWDGTITDKDTPAANKHVVEGHTRDEYFGRKIRLGIRKPPVAIHPTTGKWSTHTMKVTRGGPLGKGHKVDDVFFFASQPGSRTTRLMVDNVRLEWSE